MAIPVAQDPMAVFRSAVRRVAAMPPPRRWAPLSGPFVRHSW